MLTANREKVKLLLSINRSHMGQQKDEVLPGALNLMALNSITGAGRRRLVAEEGSWLQMPEIMPRTLESSGGSL
jgi:hypothetical protein